MLCLRLTAVENTDQPIDVPGPDLVHGRLAVRGRERKYPAALAKFERSTAYLTCIDGRGHWRSSALITEVIVRGGHDSVPSAS